ncbi:MAG TPA: cyclic nucleotide-binding domain-containing protein [Ktedonobacterales bacterium]|jgi:CRP/FNR family transcriptional regulator|nr:cyclic nucleotide-binding domain-containing protein [Ktedonobacterales bacterium]
MHEDVLSQVPLFAHLSKRDLQVLASSCRERDYPAGAPLLRQGDTGVGLFVIVSGRVRVTQHQHGGDEQELATLGSGEVLGEMSLLDDLPRSASAMALEPTQALVLPVWDFRAILRDNPDIGIGLLSVLSRRLRGAENRPN